MYGLKTIQRLNAETAEAREICEKHGVALGDIPAPTGPLPEAVPGIDLLADLHCTCGSVHCPECEYALPHVDEPAK